MARTLIFASNPHANLWAALLKEDQSLCLDSFIFQTIKNGFNYLQNFPAEVIIVQAPIGIGFSDGDIAKMKLCRCEFNGLYVPEIIAKGYADVNKETPILYTSIKSPENCKPLIEAFSKYPNTHFYHELSGKEINSVVKEIIPR